jgi:hypothetical protein
MFCFAHWEGDAIRHAVTMIVIKDLIGGAAARNRTGPLMETSL